MNETEFKGSVLYHTLINSSDKLVKHWYKATKDAKEADYNKGSKFWAEAFELIETKYNNLKKTNPAICEF